MAEPLAPGGVIGILGGGQLGRMLTLAAARLGLRCHIFDPGKGSPAAQVAEKTVVAPYDDTAALHRFAKGVDVVTYEFENVPTAALDHLEALRPIRPGRAALAVSQDRLDEKRFLQKLGLGVAPFAAAGSFDELAHALGGLGTPAILKTRRMGYDGKGQVRLTGAADAMAALRAIDHAPAILEAVVPFEREISVIAARGLNGAVACYDPGENLHRDGILHRSTVPAQITAAQRQDAALIAGKILNALDYVGVIGVELFVTEDSLVVNEIAPRVHNSGHWTQNGCTVDQFEQHIRAVAGWPLGDATRHSDVEMRNLIGDEVVEALAIAADGRSALHLYGKTGIRPGRKMGHVNRVLGPAAGPHS